MFTMLILPIIGTSKIKKLGGLQWVDVYNKSNENPSSVQNLPTDTGFWDVLLCCLVSSAWCLYLHFRVVQMVWLPQAAVSKQQNGWVPKNSLNTKNKFFFFFFLNFE
jgi:hypothetical protein